MSFPPIPTKKSDHTAFARLPLNLTDSDAVTREKYPSKLRVPTAVTPCIKELLSAKLEESKQHAKQVEALRCENTNLKQKIEELQEQVLYMRTKAATASPPAEKVQMIDQEVDATEGNLTEHIAQLREDMRELRVEKKTMQAHVSQQQDALSTLSRASANDNTAACMDFYMRHMQAAQDL
jgi:chromosome segregation ATPase